MTDSEGESEKNILKQAKAFHTVSCTILKNIIANTQEARVALGYRLVRLLRVFRA